MNELRKYPYAAAHVINVSRKGCVLVTYCNLTFYVTRKVFNKWAADEEIIGCLVYNSSYPYPTLNVLSPF